MLTISIINNAIVNIQIILNINSYVKEYAIYE